MAELEATAPVTSPVPVAAEAETPVEPVPVVAEAETPVEPVPVVAEAETPVEPVPVVAEAETPVEPVPVAAEAETPVEPVPAEEEAAEGSEETSSVGPDNKRKHEEIEAGGEVGDGKPAVEEEATAADVEAVEAATEVEGVDGSDGAVEKAQDDSAPKDGGTDGVDGGDAKRQRVDGETEDLVDGGQQEQNIEASNKENGDATSAEAAVLNAVELQKSALDPQEIAEEQPSSDLPTSTRKIDVPNAKVGVLIGKAGETIRFLQFNSGAKIQITRDSEVDHYVAVRTVELIGTLESINKAEQLIKDVIAEADAGGSPALVARGFGTVQSGAEQLELKVPNEKVGLIIGKGGDTIKNLQTRSGARIQLIPQHLPEGDSSKERTVRISGNKKQIEVATEMVKEVMSQVPGRPSPLSGAYNQHAYRARGPPAASQWGPRPHHPNAGYDYQHRGPYPSQTPQGYGGGYPHQPPPRGSYGTGWEQRPVQAPPQSGGYDYYGQGAPPVDTRPSGPVPPAAGGPAPASANYYGQPQGSGYGKPTHYAQSVPNQPTYGQGYNEPKYDAQAPVPQVYGQQPVISQPGQYQQQVGAPQPGYQQQTYNQPGYGVTPQGPPQSYGGTYSDPMYQGQQYPPNYGSGNQQPYPYGSAAPAQTYGGASGGSDGYMQQPSAGYAQQGGQTAPAYGQGGQAASMYPQGGQMAPMYPQGQAGYGQYPPAQSGYGEQPVAGNAGYGYQGAPASNPAYANGSVAAGSYGAPAPAGGPPPYAQAPMNPSSYDQQQVPPQSGYTGHPATAAGPAGYAKSVSPAPQAQPQVQPQAAYPQYDATAQMYGHS